MEQPPGTTFAADGWAKWSALLPRMKAWTEHVAPLIAGRDVSWLEIGSHEGRSAVWTLANLLTHPASMLVCVDHWTNALVWSRFHGNMRAIGESRRVVVIKQGWRDALRDLAVRTFGGAYIDADHCASSVMSQACMVWPLIERGGVIIFDDYGLQNKDGTPPVMVGVDGFLKAFEGQYEVLHAEWQVIIRKL